MSHRPRSLALLGLAAVGSLGGCGGPGPGADPSTGAAALLVDVTAEVGLPTDGPWPDGSWFPPEIMQGGVALLDYDGDGDLDLMHARVPPPGGRDAVAAALYRQEPGGRFVDVTPGAGLEHAGFAQGLAVGDVDNDGDLDVFLAAYGPDALFRNLGGGRFEEIAARAGVADDGWSVAAAFCDYDRDGWLDLYVAGYLRLDESRVCLDHTERRDYCGPKVFRGAPDRLYRNEGGVFRDVTAEAGLRLPEDGLRARGLGVLCADLTGDDWPDVFVANDREANQLWVNAGDGTFREEGLARGVALGDMGQPEASMGVALGDVDGNGFDDLFMTHLVNENNRLYLGDGRLFADGSRAAGLSRYDLGYTGFGCGLADLDLDGDLDIVVANGGVSRRRPIEGCRLGRFWCDYAEPNQLFENDGRGGFAERPGLAGAFGATIEVSRGLALGDLDDDGDLDIVVSNVDDTLRVYRNEAPRDGRHALLVRALTGGRDALGARVTVSVGPRTRSRTILPSSSYGSSGDVRAHFGLGESDRVDSIEVHWPDGRRERFPGGAADRVIVVEQGRGGAS